ncbi:Fc.00g073740.m01.CDS01 [Cosmosporella sp. VM-42]
MRFTSSLYVGIALAAGSLAGVVPKQGSGKPVFAHYMIGTIYDEHVQKDIADAQSLGIDAFAINFDQFADWSNATVDRLFDNADDLGFKIFFSFDMNPGYFSDPQQYAEYFQKYMGRPSYYAYDGKPLLSTFAGESVSDDQWKGLRDIVGDVVIVPGFYQATPSSSFFDNRAQLDGVFNWNSWPSAEEGKVIVSDEMDKTFQTAAKNSGKLFMMGLSPLQYKHTDPGANWYRRGEQNLEYRFGQVLEIQPDMLELQTWNDAGESHYMGNIWPEPINGSTIPAYTDGYDHTGYWQVLGPLIKAFKKGDTNTDQIFPTNDKAAQGAFWHHTLLTSGDCSSDGMGKPSGLENAEDEVTGIILVASGQNGTSVIVTSGSTQLGTTELIPGYNKFSFRGMTAGQVTVEVRNGENKVIGGSGSIEVSDSASLCNYNYQVVGLS